MLAAAIALSVAGVALGGPGAYFTIAHVQGRAEADAHIADLKAMPATLAPTDGYWHY